MIASKNLTYFAKRKILELQTMASSSKSNIILSDNLSLFFSFIENIEYSKLFILVDKNTKKHCFPFLDKNKTLTYHIFEIESGETSKNLETVTQLWSALTNLGADRKSILINLGGGVITDLGGFTASCFKRGMRFINIPTTLLGMIDASIGGKTGVDFNNLKNQIGVFSEAEAVFVFPRFLDSLPKREVLSGLAEIIKYGLTHDLSIWDYIKKSKNYKLIPREIIEKSIAVKEAVVAKDPKEKGIRKSLNFGHTLGHAVETYFMKQTKSEQLLHGEAVAIGMILAAYLSYKTIGLEKNSYLEISNTIQKIYKERMPRIDEKAITPILDLLKHDKKNTNGKVNFILLEDIGKVQIDCQVENSTIIEAIENYNRLLS